MDGFTQAALGAVIGEAVMGRRLGKLALAWGALIGAFPDLLELFAGLWVDHARDLAVTRALGHGLVPMGLGLWAVSKGLARLWKREKIAGAEVARWVGIGWAAHLGLDLISSGGVALLWPFWSKRFAFPCLPQPDWLLAIVLPGAALWLALLPEEAVKKRRGKKAPPPSKRLKIVRWGLGLAIGCVGLGAGMKSIAASGFAADLARRGAQAQRWIEGPVPGNPLLWRAVVDGGDSLRVGYRSVFERGTEPVRWAVYPKGAEAAAKVADAREARTLMALSDGWWIARPHAKGAWIGNLAVAEGREWNEKKNLVDCRLGFARVVDLESAGDHLRQTAPDGSGGMDYWKRMARRTFFGDHAAWDAYPRLTGVAGSLPESLAIEN